jgi:crotonobetaine/carnitine-CoA ligase
VPSISSHQTSFDDAPLAEQTVGNLLINRAKALPDNTFLIDGESGRQFTYSDVNDQANRIANGLAAIGINQGDRVCTLHSDPITTTLVLFGCAKRGAVFSPVNPNFTGESLNYQLTDVDPTAVVLEASLREQFDDANDAEGFDPTVVIDRNERSSSNEEFHSELSSDVVSFDQVRDASSAEPTVDCTWDDEAWIMYTSGTTGLPKGVILPHRWIAANHAGQTSLLLDETDVTHCPFPLFHITGTSYLLCSTMIAGGTVVLWEKFSGSRFWERVEDYGITFTGLIDIMVPAAVENMPEENPGQSLSKLLMGPLPEDYDGTAERMGVDILHTLYGQTESGLPSTGIIQIADELDESDDVAGKSPNDVVETVHAFGWPVVSSDVAPSYMGTPADDLYEAAILDDNDEHLPPGEVGELALRPKLPGILFSRYFGKPEKTLEDIRNLWFHTGDYARRDEAGNYYFLGRMGDVIRRRGENIAPLQVEQIISQLSGVDNVAVFPIPADLGEEDEVGAAIKMMSDANLDANAIKDHVGREAPDFMIPKRIWFVDDYPRTDTNKIRKNALKERLIE